MAHYAVLLCRLVLFLQEALKLNGVKEGGVSKFYHGCPVKRSVIEKILPHLKQQEAKAHALQNTTTQPAAG